MNFNRINIEEWPRREYYRHYMQKVPCTYSLTTNIDITELRVAVKQMGIKIYPVQIYMVATIVNQYKEFRMGMNADGELGYWDELNPSYTIFNKESETFSSVWTLYDRDFRTFFDNCIKDIDIYSQSTCLEPKPDSPANIFTLSSLPRVNFTGFNINVFTDSCYLPPIFTLSKFVEQDGKVLMPVSIQVHHVVCDGFHVGKFVGALQDLSVNYKEWLS